MSESSPNPRQLSPLVLAFVGDAAYGLLVRERLVSLANTAVNRLHNQSVQFVNAVSQAAAADQIIPCLSEDELAIFKRGRNSAVNTIPKNANSADYHKATGLEALFGYLYLSGSKERMMQLFDLVWDIIVKE